MQSKKLNINDIEPHPQVVRSAKGYKMGPMRTVIAIKPQAEAVKEVKKVKIVKKLPPKRIIKIKKYETFFMLSTSF